MCIYNVFCVLYLYPLCFVQLDCDNIKDIQQMQMLHGWYLMAQPQRSYPAMPDIQHSIGHHACKHYVVPRHHCCRRCHNHHRLWLVRHAVLRISVILVIYEMLWGDLCMRELTQIWNISFGIVYNQCHFKNVHLHHFYATEVSEILQCKSAENE